MKNRLLVTVFLVIAFPLFTCADTLVLKDGTRIEVKNYWEEDGQIKFQKYGSVIGYPKSNILMIEKEEGASGKKDELSSLYLDVIAGIKKIATSIEKNEPLDFEKGKSIYQQVRQSSTRFASHFPKSPQSREIVASIKKAEEKASEFFDKSELMVRQNRVKDAQSMALRGYYILSHVYKQACDTIVDSEDLNIEIVETPEKPW
jgi:cytochrome c556